MATNDDDQSQEETQEEVEGGTPEDTGQEGEPVTAGGIVGAAMANPPSYTDNAIAGGANAPLEGGGFGGPGVMGMPAPAGGDPSDPMSVGGGATPQHGFHPINNLRAMLAARQAMGGPTITQQAKGYGGIVSGLAGVLLDGLSAGMRAQATAPLYGAPGSNFARGFVMNQQMPLIHQQETAAMWNALSESQQAQFKGVQAHLQYLKTLFNINDMEGQLQSGMTDEEWKALKKGEEEGTTDTLFETDDLKAADARQKEEQSKVDPASGVHIWRVAVGLRKDENGNVVGSRWAVIKDDPYAPNKTDWSWKYPTGQKNPDGSYEMKDFKLPAGTPGAAFIRRQLFNDQWNIGTTHAKAQWKEAYTETGASAGRYNLMDEPVVSPVQGAPAPGGVPAAPGAAPVAPGATAPGAPGSPAPAPGGPPAAPPTPATAGPTTGEEVNQMLEKPVGQVPKGIYTAAGLKTAEEAAKAQAQDIPITQDLIDNVASGRTSIPTAAGRGGQQFRQRLTQAMIKQYPDYSETAVKTYQKMRNDYSPGGKVGQQITAYNTALNHAGQIWDLISGSNWYELNMPWSPVKQQLDVKVPFLAAEVERAAVGAGSTGTKEEREATAKNIRGMYTGSFETRVRSAAEILQGKYDALIFGWENSMPHNTSQRVVNPPFQIISPKARAVLDKIGIAQPPSLSSERQPNGAPSQTLFIGRSQSTGKYFYTDKPDGTGKNLGPAPTPTQ